MPKRRKGRAKIEKTMHEFKEGTLRSGSGKKVKSRKQAIAIALSQARKAGAKIPSSPVHHAKKKSTGQIEREIASALQEQIASGDEHAREVLNDLILQRGGPKRADFSGNIKRLFKDLYGLKVRMRTNATKNPFIEAWMRDSPLPFPSEVRNTALDVEYGEAFERNRDNPNAGNIRSSSIAMKKPQWVELFKRLGHRLEDI